LLRSEQAEPEEGPPGDGNVLRDPRRIDKPGPRRLLKGRKSEKGKKPRKDGSLPRETSHTATGARL
jgi:hypothetical protein